jgi:hypothetical protein
MRLFKSERFDLSPCMSDGRPSAAVGFPDPLGDDDTRVFSAKGWALDVGFFDILAHPIMRLFVDE